MTTTNTLFSLESIRTDAFNKDVIAYTQTADYNKAQAAWYLASDADRSLLNDFSMLDLVNAGVWKSDPLNAYFRLMIGNKPFFISGKHALMSVGAAAVLLMFLKK